MSAEDVTRISAPSQSQFGANQTLVFTLLLAVSLLLFQGTIRAMLDLGLQSERYTHILLIPFISLCLLYWERQAIFLKTHYCPRAGIPLIALGVILYYSSTAITPSLPLPTFAIALTWTAAFLFCFGTQSVLAAKFPLCFLLLVIPVPTSFMDKASAALQYGSAEVTAVLFDLTGIPVFRQEFTFTLPGVIIEIAEECSGIRSSIALVITSLLASHIFLRSGWKKAALILATIPITIFKNAVRIVALAGLGVYVDQDFLHGDLHHRGGALFSLVALAIFLPLLGILYKSEVRTTGSSI